jgi:hypothetical protein
MRPLRYSINVTLDGCCDHREGIADEESDRYWAANLERADALLFGRVTYEMMEAAWRQPATGTWPDWMADWMIPFAQTIDSAKKYVVSSTLDQSIGTRSSYRETWGKPCSSSSRSQAKACSREE